MIAQTAASKHWPLRSLDARNAYFQGEKMDRDVWVRPPAGYDLPGVEKGSLIKADQSIYGFTDGARKLWLRVKKVFTGLGAKCSLNESAFFYLRDRENKLIAVFLLHIDDVLYTAKPCAETDQFMERLSQEIEWGAVKDAKDGFQYCGRWYQQHEDFSITISMKSYAQGLETSTMTRERRAQEEDDLRPKEFTVLRGLGGQVQWLGRMGNPRLGFRASRLASSFKGPKVKDLKEANAIIRLARRLQNETLRFTDDIQIEDCAVLGIQDASFDNLEGSKSQGGRWLMLADKKILDQTSELVPCSLMEWHSGRIKRVVRATLTAEAYSMGESGESVDHLRGLLAELFDPSYTPATRDECSESIPAGLVTDARSLFDGLQREGAATKDRRLRLEFNLIRDMRNCKVIWIHSEQMVADELTKEVPEEVHAYAKLVRDSGRWCLGVDPRAPPSRRGRALEPPSDSPIEESLGQEFVVLLQQRLEGDLEAGRRLWLELRRMERLKGHRSGSLPNNSAQE